MKQGSLTIKTTAELAGLKPGTIRAWERRYQAVVAKRTQTGRRAYSIDDVEKLKLLSVLSQNGHFIGQIAKLTVVQLGSLKDTLPGAAAHFNELPEEAHRARALIGLGQKSSRLDNKNQLTYLSRILPQLREALKALDISKANQILNQSKIVLGSRSFVLDVLVPTFKTVGDLVASGAFDIVHEHALSSHARNHLGQLLQELNPWDTSPLSAVFATPEGDLHEFGSLMAATLFSGHGLNAKYLGPNLPTDNLAQAVVRSEANILVIGSSPLPEAVQKLSFSRFIHELDRKIPKQIEFWFGGPLANLDESLRGRKVRRFESLHQFDECIFQLISGGTRESSPPNT